MLGITDLFVSNSNTVKFTHHTSEQYKVISLVDGRREWEVVRSDDVTDRDVIVSLRRRFPE